MSGGNGRVTDSRFARGKAGVAKGERTHATSPQIPPTGWDAFNASRIAFRHDGTIQGMNEKLGKDNDSTRHYHREHYGVDVSIGMGKRQAILDALHQAGLTDIEDVVLLKGLKWDKVPHPRTGQEVFKGCYLAIALGQDGQPTGNPLTVSESGDLGVQAGNEALLEIRNAQPAELDEYWPEPGTTDSPHDPDPKELGTWMYLRQTDHEPESNYTQLAGLNAARLAIHHGVIRPGEEHTLNWGRAQNFPPYQSQQPNSLATETTRTWNVGVDCVHADGTITPAGDAVLTFVATRPAPNSPTTTIRLCPQHRTDQNNQDVTTRYEVKE